MRLYLEMKMKYKNFSERELVSMNYGHRFDQKTENVHNK